MILLIDNIDVLKSWRSSLQDNSLGFVPTMGNLHQGHLGLVEQSQRDNEQSIVSIFVNPRQFCANEDFKRYPRTLEEDLEALKPLSLHRPLTVFAPQEFYPKNFSTVIKVEGPLTEKLCGRSRPHHFAGVTTVVHLLFSLIRPSRAYFGQKDYQQFKVIEKMTHDLDLPIHLKMIPIVRDARGLALSSRNKYLSPEQYNKALILNKTLNKVASALANNEAPGPLPNNGYCWDYLDVLDAANLEALSSDTKQILIAGALKIGNIRLIDNTIVTKDAR